MRLIAPQDGQRVSWVEPVHGSALATTCRSTRNGLRSRQIARSPDIAECLGEGPSTLRVRGLSHSPVILHPLPRGKVGPIPLEPWFRNATNGPVSAFRSYPFSPILGELARGIFMGSSNESFPFAKDHSYRTSSKAMRAAQSGAKRRWPDANRSSPEAGQATLLC